MSKAASQPASQAWARSSQPCPAPDLRQQCPLPCLALRCLQALATRLFYVWSLYEVERERRAQAWAELTRAMEARPAPAPAAAGGQGQGWAPQQEEDLGEAEM